MKLLSTLADSFIEWLEELFCSHSYKKISEEFVEQERDTSSDDAGELFDVFIITRQCLKCGKIEYQRTIKFPK